MKNRAIDMRLVVVMTVACITIAACLLVAMVTHHIIAGIVLAAVIRFGATIARWQILR